jgi:hypothetical protein
MKKMMMTVLALSALGTIAAQAATVSNPWSGADGDRANWSAFVFRATAGTFPASVTPTGALDGAATFTLNSLTFTRPANDVAGTQVPSVSGDPGGLSSLTADVYVDVYSSRTGTSDLNFTGFLGSSTNGFAWRDIGGTDLINPGDSYTYNFSGLTLDKNTEYWLVFSETSGDGGVANFRTRVNTSGSDAIPGPGAGYLTGNPIQLVTPGATPTNREWGVEYSADVTPVVPEPSSIALSLIVLGLGIAARKGNR